MQQIYSFNIEEKQVGVNSDDGQSYHVSIDGKYAGIIFPEFNDDLGDGSILWTTKDLISNELVIQIGIHIEDEDL
ncbi:hypothetical protein AAKU52_002362 [Pedobacter sp. CG_S7]|uniref:hypothetical protein n=1 Tax=Pedobacter sp. CG_S7 TaxID=3143930 RepID=UPI00339972ED